MKRHPQRRPLDFQDLEQVLLDVRHLSADGYDRLGTWTLGQVCDHLAIFFRGSLEGFTQKVPWLIRVLLGRMLFRHIIRRRGMGEGIKVPRSFLPGDAGDDAASAEQLVELIERFRTHAGEYEPSPLFGRLSRDEWTQLHLIHCSHHLSFLIPQNKDGPSPGGE